MLQTKPAGLQTHKLIACYALDWRGDGDDGRRRLRDPSQSGT